jgi:hypothetical protein
MNQDQHHHQQQQQQQQIGFSRAEKSFHLMAMKKARTRVIMPAES